MFGGTPHSDKHVGLNRHPISVMGKPNKRDGPIVLHLISVMPFEGTPNKRDEAKYN